MSDYGIGIIGTGHSLPEYLESNEELCRHMNGVTPEWIVEKTGIQARYIASEADSASDLASSAARKALDHAGIKPEQLGLIIVCTASGDYMLPHVAANVHRKLGAKKTQTFDLQASCAGFASGIVVAADRMKADSEIEYALVIGVEMLTRFCNRADVNSAIFLSDGAGAVVLGRVESGKGILSSDFHTDSSTFESVRLRCGGSSFPMYVCKEQSNACFLEMDGLATWKQAITYLPIVVRNACKKANIPLHEINFFLFHQANLNLIRYVVKKLGADLDRTYTNVERIGNTGSASLAIVLDEALRKGLVKTGDKVVLAVVGAGFSFGASVWRW